MKKMNLIILFTVLFVITGCGKSNEAPAAGNMSSTTPEASATTSKDLTFEIVSQNGEIFVDSLGDPTISYYYEIKNTSDVPIFFPNPRIEYVDNSGKLLAVDSYVECIPKALKPGQIGYVYSYYYDLSSIDLSNGFMVQAGGDPVEATNFYEVAVSDVTVGKGFVDYQAKVTARGTNNGSEDIFMAQPGAVLYDKDNNVVGFSYDLVSFGAGQSVGFELIGNLLSSDYDLSMVDHAVVYIQGNAY